MLHVVCDECIEIVMIAVVRLTVVMLKVVAPISTLSSSILTKMFFFPNFKSNLYISRAQGLHCHKDLIIKEIDKIRNYKR